MAHPLNYIHMPMRITSISCHKKSDWGVLLNYKSVQMIHGFKIMYLGYELRDESGLRGMISMSFPSHALRPIIIQ